MPYVEAETPPYRVDQRSRNGGPTLAFWLRRYVSRVIVVEIAAQIQPGGQTVDLHAPGERLSSAWV